jgi:hypothetical protein
MQMNRRMCFKEVLDRLTLVSRKVVRDNMNFFASGLIGNDIGYSPLLRLALGPGFENSVSVLRVFAVWIPLIALSTVLIFQVLLPNHLDNHFNLATFTSALVSIGLQCYLHRALVPLGSHGRRSLASFIPSLLIPPWHRELA